jgi:glycolate oxidase
VNDSIVDELRRALPVGAVLHAPDEVEAYRWDRARDPGAGVPAAVALPASTAEVQAVVRVAASAGIPVVPRGAGSGLSGGSSAVDGAIVVSLERMTGVEIDPVRRLAVVRPGTLNAELKAAAAQHGLWYPPDPASQAFCSIGGNVATNAGGLCCVKYGVTGDYVLGMEVVLADGRAVILGGPRVKDVAGLSLLKLFVGSEGTLGIITQVTLRLIPAQRPPITLLATFAHLADATAACAAIAASERPSMLEFMDNVSINAVEDANGFGLDRSAAALIVVQSDEPAAEASDEIARVQQLCHDHSAVSCRVAADADEGESLVAARRAAIPAMEQRGHLLLGDVGVPIDRLKDLVDGIAAIGERRDVTISVIAHAGDGNTHPMLLTDPADPAQLARADIAYGEVMDLAIQLGGTITGEHGAGRTKQPWLADYLGPDVVELNERVKHALDPDGLLNPGALFIPKEVG